MKTMIVIVLLCGAVIAQTSTDKAEKIRAVRTVFVQGNNFNAQLIRGKMENDKHSCLTLAGKADDADAVLDVSPTDEVTRWVSATLVNHAGEMIWSETFPDAAGIYEDLLRAACSHAKPKKEKK